VALVLPTGPGQDGEATDWKSAGVRLHLLIDVSARGKAAAPGRRRALTSWLGKIVRHLCADRPLLATADEVNDPNDLIVRFWNDGSCATTTKHRRHREHRVPVAHRVPAPR